MTPEPRSGRQRTAWLRRALCDRCHERRWDWSSRPKSGRIRLCRPCIVALAESFDTSPAPHLSNRCRWCDQGTLADIERFGSVLLCIKCVRIIMQDWARIAAGRGRVVSRSIRFIQWDSPWDGVLENHASY